jgi:DMSO/TMAO reductase YedYZ molybdopterin-dependent catalytic subunit
MRKISASSARLWSARLWSALTGIVAVLGVLAVAEVAALVVGTESSPFFAVGQLAIDLSPLWLKEGMIALFGTADKAALFVILASVVLIAAALAGILERRRPPHGIVVFVTFSGIAVVAIMTRPGSSAAWAFPTVLGMIVGVVILRLSQRRLAAWVDATDRQSVAADVERVTDAPSLERRQFFRFVGVSAAVAVVAGLGARAMNASTRAVTAIRSSIMLPAAAAPAPPIPAGASLAIEGISPLITANTDFYRIDVALQVPQINPADWSLRITGLVAQEVTISYAELLALPLVEHTTTIACVSNDVGGDLIGTATWLGYPIRELLARARPAADADMVLSSGPDGFTAGTPLSTLTDPARESLLAVGMNGEVLPSEHGFPARMIVPGLFGYVSATKWVTEMRVTRFADDQGYWTPRGWSALGPVKTSSRMDVPRPNSSVAIGTVPIAGVAWSQHIGISRVEVQVDDGVWQLATLSTPISDDTWVQWSLAWEATAGDHILTVRATDKTGYTQTKDYAPPAPNGSTGWTRRKVTAR